MPVQNREGLVQRRGQPPNRLPALSAAMSRERGDRMQLPAHPRQIGQAQMPCRVGGELRHPSGDCDAPQDLRSRPQTQGLRLVATRLRQEQRPPGPAQRRPMRQILLQQHDGFGGAYWRRPHAYLDDTVQAGMAYKLIDLNLSRNSAFVCVVNAKGALPQG